jgi:hypothetical protein
MSRTAGRTIRQVSAISEAFSMTCTRNSVEDWSAVLIASESR